jgi:hypothetical protein
MTSISQILNIQPPESIAPYVSYVRALDKFNNHANDLYSVLSLIAHRCPDAKFAGLNDDLAYERIVLMLKDLRMSVQPGRTPEQNAYDVRERILRLLSDTYRVNKENIEYFDHWMFEFKANVVDLVAVADFLEYEREAGRIS